MRYLDQALEQLSRDKFVLLCGPRQVGKTTLAKSWLKEKDGLYLNWDIPEDRETLLKSSFASSTPQNALVLDELHKYARWKSWLKGLYDRRAPELRAVITGSARLDVFQRGGDSLLGRHELLHLHPLSIGELMRSGASSAVGIPEPPKDWLSLDAGAQGTSKAWLQLERMGGFPEPFFKDDPMMHRRWSTRRRELLIREDLREISQIKQLSLVEHLAILLPSRVGAPLSVNSLRAELQVAFDTVKSWLESLERLYLCFRISPYSRKISRSLRKEQKLYLWDWSQVENDGARFENMVASHLLKATQAWTDVGYGSYELLYWRDLEKREVDFVVTENRKPVALIECKRSDRSLSPSLIRLGEHLGQIPQIQLIAEKDVDLVRGRTRVVSADRYLAGLV